MMAAFLADRPVSRPEQSTAPARAESEAALASSDLTIQQFNDLREDPAVRWTVHLSELTAEPIKKRPAFFFRGTGGYSTDITLPELLRRLSPGKTFAIPEALTGVRYSFAYLDKDPGADSEPRLLR